MIKSGKEIAAEHLQRLLRWKDAIIESSQSIFVEPSIVAAIISRETSALDKWCLPPPQGQLGDNGHGHGPMQIDDRSFPDWCKKWRDGFLKTEDGITQGCIVLKLKKKAITRLIPEMMPELRLQAAIASYNSGEGNVRRAFRKGYSIDTYTAHADYSRDVLERAIYLRENGFKNT